MILPVDTDQQITQMMASYVFKQLEPISSVMERRSVAWLKFSYNRLN